MRKDLQVLTATLGGDLHSGGTAAAIMTTSSTNDLLAEIWAIKDSLSASQGNSLKDTCRAIYAEQEKHPGDFVNFGAAARQNQMLGTPGALPPTPQTGRAA